MSTDKPIDFEDEQGFEDPARVDAVEADGIRAALKRTDLTDEDRTELEAALKRLDPKA